MILGGRKSQAAQARNSQRSPCGQSRPRVTQQWPKEEKFSLTDQVRRASRAMGANVSESWAKRRYPAHFVSKLTDADGEVQETSHWLAPAQACGYLSGDCQLALQQRLEAIGAKLGKMMAKPESFVPKL